MSRGLVVPLTSDERVARWKYLAGELPLGALDRYVRKQEDELLGLGGYAVPIDFDPMRVLCPTLYYLLEAHNGGKDPTAPDPAVRWRVPGGTNLNRTVDCSGGVAWACGHDRFLHQFRLYRESAATSPDGKPGGWANTNSKILDVRTPLKPGELRCYEDAGRPEPGCIIVCASGSPGHAVGHEGGVIAYNGLEWDPKVRACWDLIDVVDCAARTGRSNKRTTGRGWYGTGAMFLVPVMQP
jgi:hypothetical protein